MSRPRLYSVTMVDSKAVSTVLTAALKRSRAGVTDGVILIEWKHNNRLPNWALAGRAQRLRAATHLALSLVARKIETEETESEAEA